MNSNNKQFDLHKEMELKQNRMNSKKKSKIWLIIPVFIILAVILAGGYFISGNKEIQVPGSAKHFKGKQCSDVVQQLEDAGFTNIQTEEVQASLLDFFEKENDVDSITIEGKDDFKKGDSFKKNAQVRIKYLTKEKAE